MKIERLKLFLINNWPLVFLFVIGIVIPLHWFADGRIIGGGDHFLYYNPPNVFSDYFYTWLERMNLGEPNFEIQLLFPFLSFFKFFNLIGFSNLVAEVLWAIYLFLGSGFFMYLLVLHLLKNKSVWAKAAALVAAIFYNFNPYVMLDLLQTTARPVQVVFPLLFLLWLKGLEAGKGDLKFSLLFALSTLLFASSATSPAFVSVVGMAIFLYTIYFIFLYKNLWLKTVFFTFKTLFFSLLLNLWWIIPTVFAFAESGKNIETVISSVSFVKSTKIWEAFRLMGFWAFRIQWGGTSIPHIPFAHFYYEFPLLFVSYLFPLIAFLGLVIKPKNKKLIFFGFLFLLGAFLAKGTNFPLGSIFQFFYNKIPFFTLFRNPYSKFTPLTMFALSVLLGLSWSYLLNLVSSRWRILLTTFLLGANIALAFPILTGQSFQNPSWHKTTRDSFHAEIPQYWFDISEWLKKTYPQARVILFPKSGYGVCYNWEMGTCSGEPIGRMFLPNQIVKYPGPEVYPRDLVLNNLYNSVFQGELKDFTPALGSFGVKYILQQNDLDWAHAFKDTFPPEKMASLLKSQKNLKLVGSFGQLDVYSLGEDEIYPWLYSTSDLNKPYHPLVIDSEIPQIVFKRINPTRFEVEVSNAQNPYYLVFLSSFSKNWKAYFLLKNEQRWFAENRHLMVNGFANGWYINPEDVNYQSNYRIILEYLPQKFFYLGLLISTSSVILSLGYLYFRKKRQDD